MANPIKHETPTDEGNVLTTELNSLADNAYSAFGTALDNAANKDQSFVAEINLASLNPTTGAFVTLFAVPSYEGTNYADAPSSTNPGRNMIAAQVDVATGSAAKVVNTPPFALPPFKHKFVLRNDTNVTLGASGNTVKIRSFNPEIQ